jgi:hypothetical protein
MTWTNFGIFIVFLYGLLWFNSLQRQIADVQRRLELAIARGPNKERADYLANELAQEAEDRSRRRDFWGRVMAWGGAIIIGLLILLWAAT